MTEIHDRRLHELLVHAEREDLNLLHKEVSSYLEFWRIVDESDDAGDVPVVAEPRRRAA